MKTSLMICTAALVLRTCVAHAGIDLSWDGCAPNAAAVGDKVFTCDGSNVYQMYASYQPPVPITNFIAISGQIVIQSATGPIQPFWAFEAGGCNETSFAPSDARGAVNPVCNIPTQWGTTGTIGMESWLYTRNGPTNRAFFDFTVFRATPVASIAAGSNQYAFTLTFDEMNAPGAGGADCAGCHDNVVWYLRYIDIVSTTNPTVRVSDLGLRSNCATANGNNPSVCSVLSSCTSETCDGVDNDCDGQIDEGFTPVGWWRGEGNANDAVGSSHGSLMNGAGFAGGRVGQAFSLDGVDDYIGDLGTAATFSFIENTGVFTIEGWIKLNDSNAIRQQAITANTGATVEKGFYFTWDNSAGQRLLRLLLLKGESGNPVIASASDPDVIGDSQWHHVAAVGNGTGITFYVDGTGHPATGVMGSMPTGDATRRLAIGSCSSEFSWCAFAGQIDELSIYNRSLNATEIGALYGAGSGSHCGVVSVDEPPVDPPGSGPLGISFAAHPNPGHGEILFRGSVPFTGATIAHITIVDPSGRRVATMSASISRGRFVARWDGHDSGGARVPAGVYFAKLEAGAVSSRTTLILAR